MDDIAAGVFVMNIVMNIDDKPWGIRLQGSVEFGEFIEIEHDPRSSCFELRGTDIF